MLVGFLRRDRKNVDLDGWGHGEDLGGAEERESIFRVYYMKKIYF